MLGDIKETWATEDAPDSPEIDVSVQVVLPSEEEMRLLDFCQTFFLGYLQRSRTSWTKAQPKTRMLVRSGCSGPCSAML